MQLIHYCFLIQTQINGHTAYLVNTKRNYILNVLTQVSPEEISQKAICFLNNIIQLENESLEYVYCSCKSQFDIVLIRLNLNSTQIPKLKGYNWVGGDFLRKLILNFQGEERELFLSKINSTYIETHPNLSH